MAEPLVIICEPVRAEFRPVPGSTTSRCSRCRHRVWAAPSSLEAMARADACLVCRPCIFGNPDEAEAAILEAVRRGPIGPQLDELAAWRAGRAGGIDP